MLLGGAGVALVGSLLVRGLLEGLIFHPVAGAQLRPEELGLTAEDVFLEVEPGLRVHAYWVPAAGASRAILYLHGNAGNASHRLPLAAVLASLGAHVLLLDYRGYGRSQGRPSELGAYADARAALAHLEGARALPPERIVVFGHSLGAAIAIEAARGRSLAGVVLESAFTSVRDVANSHLPLPLGGLLGRRFDALARIAELRSPLLFLHGDRDEIVPFELGRRLYEGAPEPKRFAPIPGAGHNDTLEVGGAAYLRRIGGFLDEVAPRSGTGLGR